MDEMGASATDNLINYLLVALEAAEHIVGDDASEWWDMENAHRRFRGRTREMHEKLSAVYRIVHSANFEASCYHVHERWRVEAEGVLGAKESQPTKEEAQHGGLLDS